MSLDHIVLTPELSAYYRQVTLRDSDLLRRLRAETAVIPMGGMQISPEQGQFMRLLVSLIGARKTLEVGVFTGYSSLSVAMSLPDDGRIIACDVSEEWTSVARRYWAEAGVAHKIELRLKPAVESLNELLTAGQAGTFDFAFIDADKENYDNYYERALQLVRVGGLIAIDNVLWHGRVVDAACQDADTLAIRALNQKIHDDERVDECMVPLGDGLTLVCKRT